MATVDQYSLTVSPLALTCGGQQIGHATGFFFKHASGRYLVSNWHVFSGRNAYSGQPLHRDHAIPDEVGVFFHREGVLGEFGIGPRALLYDSGGRPKWIQHRSGQAIDVAVLPIPDLPPGCSVMELPREDEAAEMALTVGADAFVVGFPKGLAQQKFVPIWKRASIATEPDLPYQELPVFLVDAATRDGMSGSPVFLRSFGTFQRTTGDMALGHGAFTRFIGVYSGRFGADDELAAQLGRVWHRHVIEQIIADGVPGEYVLSGG